MNRVREPLGTWWRYVVTDRTAGTSGNGERLAVPRRLAVTERGGVFDYFDVVFRESDERTYAATMGEPYRTKRAAENGKALAARYYKDWRTHQMSDHLVLWAELQIGWAEEALAERAAS